MAVLSNLEPKAVFEYFEKLCAVPHGSGNTKIISDLCVGFAKELGLKWRQDALNNVVIWKGGTPGYENAEPVILQGHMDMVCAKTEHCDKDMTREGLDLATDGEYVWAEETSLGGDNCIAVAMALALLADKTMPHPPLEAVFTVDEEVGMEGAFGLDCSDLKGRQLLNLDSEEEGVFTVSCAGGVRMDCRLPGSRGPLTGETGYAVTISGLQGGHSGADIDKGRASANVLAGRVLYSAMERVPGLRLADVRGGKFDNVICPFNVAKVAVPAGKEAEFEAFIREFDGVLKNEYAGCDEGVTLVCQRTAVETALSPEDTHRILRTLLALPQGVQAMNADFPGLVQTSLNLGVMSVEADGLHLTLSIRSCIASQKAMLCQRVRAVIETGGGTAEERSGYPGWQYQRESAMRQRLMEVYRDLNGKDAVIEATHGGLECGLFIEKLPGLDAVSLGPELRDIHSPRERLGVASTQRVYRLVCEFLKRSK
ncbi:aminoacyl-histidine dipeptidase [Oscillibacter sp.]|jgi:dipeptidase D|uniref:aminoacyl-histidine dipeptidase n=1 Tax=Oscillibacter sp. TaxID=1945593 RepID=UPI0021706BB8|nr:aminoacyl-histidine dipeptidase [Oscillibacter sp.]MCI9648514.1 aminoacyl-histidine dipeptidase [Oscillibacter sp.]